MNQPTDKSARALATLVTALGITIGATPATLHAQTATPSQAVQDKTRAASRPDVLQKSAAEQAKEAAKLKAAAQAKAAVQRKDNVQQNAPASAIQLKRAAEAKVPATAPVDIR